MDRLAISVFSHVSKASSEPIRMAAISYLISRFQRQINMTIWSTSSSSNGPTGFR